jgi:lipid-binding SYLF domain-containing protein
LRIGPKITNFSKVASILKTAALATGVSLGDSGIEFLTQVERGVYRILLEGEWAISGEVASALDGAVPTLLLRRRPL